MTQFKPIDGRHQRLSVEERFWGKVEKTSTCWVWRAKRIHAGYGQFWPGPPAKAGEYVLATHFAWKLAYHQIVPKGLWVLHRCDNPPCVRIDHLFLGTRTDNAHDMAMKGRGAHHPGYAKKGDFARGEAHPDAKLTEDQVIYIRSEARRGTSLLVLANAFGCSRSAIQQIVKRKTWRHVA